MNKLVVLSICAVLSANCSDQASSSSGVAVSDHIVNTTRQLHDAIRRNDLAGVRTALERGATIYELRPKSILESLSPAIFFIYVNIRNGIYVSEKIFDLVFSKYSPTDLVRIVNTDYDWDNWSIALLAQDIISGRHGIGKPIEDLRYRKKLFDVLRPYFKKHILIEL